MLLLLFTVTLFAIIPLHQMSKNDLDCLVQFHLDLAEQPDVQHKAQTENLHSPSTPILMVGAYQWITLECDCCCDDEKADQIKQAAAKASAAMENTTALPAGELYYDIVSTNGHVVVLSEFKKSHEHAKSHHVSIVGTDTCMNLQTCSELYVKVKCDQVGANGSAVQGFYLYADNLGRSRVRTSLIWINKSENDTAMQHVNHRSADDRTISPYKKWPITDARIFVNSTTWSNQTAGHWEPTVDVTILLRPQKFHMASDWGAAIIAFMLALSVGCCNDPQTLKANMMKKPSNVVLEMICQLIIIPLISVGMGTWLSMENNQAFGLFVTATVPGGGLAYLLTYLVDGDRHLSAVMSFAVCCVNLVTCPLWMVTFGWYWYKRPIHLGKTVGWLGTIAFAQILGTLIRACRPGLSYAILTWVTRPLLLLSGILLVTLGVYINHYAFREINRYLILSLLLLITLAFFLGWIAARLNRENLAVTKAMATESAVFNGLLCMPLLRTSVHAPEGDLAAVVPLWMTLLFPIPLIYHAILTVLNRRLTKCLEKRRNRKKRSMRSVLIGMENGSDAPMINIGATSAAAVTAAAIAVAPAIAATNAAEQRAKNRVSESSDDGTRLPSTICKRRDIDTDLMESHHNNRRHSLDGKTVSENRRAIGREDSPKFKQSHPPRIANQHQYFDQSATIYENPTHLSKARKADRKHNPPPYTNL